MNQREQNIAIFEDTEKQCKTQERLKQAVKNSSAKQRIYLETELVGGQGMKTGEAVTELEMKENISAEKKTTVVVSKKRSFEAAAAYKGKQVCVHNFASATNPGGGVIHGSTAQEECLCRTSTLYFNLNEKKNWDGFYGPHRAMNYPVYNDDCIYTPEVVVFKDDSANPEMMPEKDWYTVNVLTCAAPNLREKPSNQMNPGAGTKRVVLSNKELLDIHVKRGSKILEIAKENHNEVVILGAFGCGAFQNPPEVVAEAYTKLLAEFEGAFETIEFAVYCSPKDTTNFDVFQRKIKAYLAGRKK